MWHLGRNVSLNLELPNTSVCPESTPTLFVCLFVCLLWLAPNPPHLPIWQELTMSLHKMFHHPHTTLTHYHCPSISLTSLHLFISPVQVWDSCSVTLCDTKIIHCCVLLFFVCKILHCIVQCIACIIQCIALQCISPVQVCDSRSVTLCDTKIIHCRVFLFLFAK